MIKKIALILSMIILFSQFTFGESIRISQIDNSSLLLNQKVKLYISVTDDKGSPIKDLDQNLFTIFESPDGKQFKEAELMNFNTNANYEKGINFLLLIDNSGSMYNDMNGKATKVKSKKRINNAKEAVINFLRSIQNPQDKVGIASYNSYYTSHSMPVNDKEKISKYLEEINQPVKNEGWSEIYSSIYLAVDDFRRVKGRKAIVILSDGVNMPYNRYVKEPHKVFGDKIFDYKEPIDECLKEGISVYVINFGKPGEKKDKNLRKIASQTGGVVFNAYNKNELNNIYLMIMDQILNEYLIIYKAKMDPTDRKFVKVNYEKKKEKRSVTRFYFSSMIFGIPLEKFTPLLLIPILISLILLWLLSLIKFKKERSVPSLELLEAPVGTIITKSLSLGKGQTIIGSSKNANMTIVNAPSVKDEHATIIFDKKKNNYNIQSKEDVFVNNKPVKTKALESGDVINVAGTLIVFDEGMMKDKKKKL